MPGISAEAGLVGDRLAPASPCPPEQSVAGGPGTEATLAKVAELARRTIPGAAGVSVTLLRGTGARSAAFTGRLALQLDEWQVRAWPRTVPRRCPAPRQSVGPRPGR